MQYYEVFPGGFFPFFESDLQVWQIKPTNFSNLLRRVPPFTHRNRIRSFRIVVVVDPRHLIGYQNPWVEYHSESVVMMA